jgi:3-hydroxyisobutyrate dehydrogenase
MGIMGSAMAFNLLKAGHNLTVWNRTQSRAVLAELAAAGASVATTVQQCVAEADIVFTCLGDEQDVISRLTGPQDSIAKHGKQGALIVDFSTIGPDAAVCIAESLRPGGMRFLDAPVTGGDVGARNATLTIMVGGEKDDFDQALPLLMYLGKYVRYCGPSGAGQALKLCNQILCAVNMVSVCEALTLAQSLGLDQALVVDVLGGGAGGSWALANLGKRILQDDLKPAFSLRNMLKDLRLVFASLEPEDGSRPTGTGETLPGTALAEELFARIASGSSTAPDDFGTQSMIMAYDPSRAKSYQLPGLAKSV